MNPSGIDTETPAYLIPRMGDLPISNVRTFRTAVVTQVNAPKQSARSARSAEWTVDGGFSSGLLGPLTALAISPDGSILAVADKTGLRLWDVAKKQAVGGLLVGHSAPVRELAFSPDGSLVVSLDGTGGVFLWETGTGKQRGNALTADSAFGLEFSPQGALLIRRKDGLPTLIDLASAGDANGTIAFWPSWPRPMQGPGLQQVTVGTGSTKSGTFTQTGLKDWREVSAQGQFQFNEINRDEWSVYLHDPSRDVYIQIDLSRKKILYSEGQSAKRDLYDILGATSAAFTSVKAAFVPQGPVFAAGDANGTLSFWTGPVTGPDLRNADFGTGNTKLGTYLQTGPKAWEELNAQGQTTYRFDEVNRDDWSVYLNDPSRGVSIQIDVFRKKIVYGEGQAAKRDLYDVLSAAPAAAAVFRLRWIVDQPQTGSIKALAISSDGRIVAAGGEGGPIALWRWSSGDLACKPFMIDSGVTELTFSPDGSVLASLHQNGTLALWDATTGERLPDYQQRPPLQVAAFSADWSLLAVGSGNGTITLLRDTQDIIAHPFFIPKPAGLVQTARPAAGALLTHEQSWSMQGLALGELLHSVCLAPGEITQIAVTNHSSRTMQQSVDTAGQEESLSQTGSEASSLSESERASASESSSGGSTAVSAGFSAQAGVSTLFASAGSSTNASTAVMANFSSGTRNVADESNQSVHQSATEAARLSRRLYSAAVREVSESDNVELRTRVVANYNHMHALNVQYYEVVQVQRLRTRITDAFRLLFIPMQIIDFANPVQRGIAAARFRRELVDVTRALGFNSVAVCLDLLALGEPLTQELIDYRLSNAWNRAEELEKAVTEHEAILKQADALCIGCEDSVLTARDNLRSFNAKQEEASMAERAKLQRALQSALEQSRLADASRKDTLARVQRLQADWAQAKALKSQLREFIDPFIKDPAKPALDPKDFSTIEDLVFKVLADNQLAVNQGLWTRIDPSTYAGLLQGQAVDGESLATTVDPTPVAIAGNYAGFRWHHTDPIEEKLFRLRFVGTETLEDSVALPTSGVFGEAVLGDSNAAEKIDLTRFWNWSEALPPIRPTSIAPLKQPTGTAPTAPALPTVAAPGTQLGPIVFPQVSSGIPMLADALKNPDLFRDMSGSKASAALARSAVELAAQGSDAAAKVAQKNFQRQLAFQEKMAEALLDNGPSGAAAGKASLDPTLAGGLINANPDLADGEASDDGDSSSEGEKLDAESGDEDQTGAAAGDDQDKLEIEFVEEQA